MKKRFKTLKAFIKAKELLKLKISIKSLKIFLFNTLFYFISSILFFCFVVFNEAKMANYEKNEIKTEILKKDKDNYIQFKNVIINKNNPLKIGVFKEDKTLFIDIFKNFQLFFILSILFFPIFFFLNLMFSSYFIKIKEKENIKKNLDIEIETNNKVMMNLIENFEHKLNTPFEILHYLETKESISKDELQSLFFAFNEIKEFSKRIKDIINTFNNKNNSFYFLIDKGFKLIFYKNLMYDFYVKIDNTFKSICATNKSSENIILMIFYRIAEEFVDNNICKIKVNFTKFSKNIAVVFVFEDMEYQMLNCGKNRSLILSKKFILDIKSLLEIIDGDFDETETGIEISIPAEKII